jgi:hypothetical protein
LGEKNIHQQGSPVDGALNYSSKGLGFESSHPGIERRTKKVFEYKISMATLFLKY